jgi:DNA-binding transcriptional LysR family regulator
MDLRQLHYFVVVVEAQGLRKAARDLWLAPSALSRALQQLEKELGVKLLRRSPGGMTPTAAGYDLLGYARSILADTEAAVTAMREHAQASSSSPLLRIGAVCGLLAAGELTEPILSSFREQYPAVTLQPRQTWWGDQIRPLVEGHLDVALVRNPIVHSGVELIPLAREPRVLLVGDHHDLAGQDEVDVEAVLEEPTVRLRAPESWSGFWQLDDVRGRSNADPGIASATSLRDLAAAVATSNAVVSTSGSVGRMALAPGTRCIGLRGVKPSTISIARRQGDRRPVVEAFCDLAAQVADECIGLLPGGVPA